MKVKRLLVLILWVVLGFVVGLLLGEVMNRHGDAVLPENFSITAHTGCMKTEDNSVESIKVGLENADIIEFDVVFDSNGTPVLAHDKATEGSVKLEEAFRLLSKAKGKKANIDLKEFTYLKEIQTLAEKYKVVERVFFTGIEEKHVDKVKKDCPKIKYYLNMNIVKIKLCSRKYIDSVIETVKKNGAVGVNCRFRNVNKRFVTVFHENDLEVSLWTANTKAEIRQVISLAPNNITSKNPELVRTIIDYK